MRSPHLRLHLSLIHIFPVFAQFSGGFQNLIGPTGGYIIGYIAGAWVTGLLVNKFSKRSFFLYALAMAAGLAACYALGTA